MRRSPFHDIGLELDINDSYPASIELVSPSTTRVSTT